MTANGQTVWVCFVVAATAVGLSHCGRPFGEDPLCIAADDCDDGNPCTVDTCEPNGVCRYAPVDQDGDGHGDVCGGGDDCDDSNPAVFPGAAEVCDDGVDNDCDGETDCDDTDCASAPACCTPSAEVCDDGVDNDCDGQTDCGDSDCSGQPVCCVPTPEQCGDGEDKDCDGLTDCADPDCGGSVSCGGLECVPHHNAASCGDSLYFCASFGGTLRLDRYSCGGPLEPGMERAWVFPEDPDLQPNRRVQVTAHLRPNYANMDLFVLQGDQWDDPAPVCDAGRCVAFGTNPGIAEEWVTFVAEPGRLYYLVVDMPGFTGPEGACCFVDLTCIDVCDPVEDCSDGFDNDCDDLTDCEDPDCALDSAC